jgi:trehalose 6-phosphate synthase/phosphatase
MKHSTPESVGQLVVVSNRLPVVLARRDDGGWDVQPGAGGLVSALAPVLRDRGGTWIGWPGTGEDEGIPEALATASKGSGYELTAVPLSDTLIEGYYHGFSNGTIWPLFHDLASLATFRPDDWRAYQQANQAFADTIASVTSHDDWIWVHDYQLMLVAERLNAGGAARRAGFFLHIPFPPVDVFVKLPWRFQILRALLDFDLLGFQTQRDTQNFIACVRALLRGVRITRERGSFTIDFADGSVRVGSFPIGLDFGYFASRAEDDDVQAGARLIHDNLPNQQLILGIDRLDYTKGLPERMVAFQDALRRHPDLLGAVTLFQVVVPSREDVPEYQALKRDIEQLVGEINGEFTQPGWTPIHYMYRSLSKLELLSYYCAAEICLVTSLKDGMNLVSKEYCATNIHEDGVLVLSEFAGSAGQLRRGALLVNPFDVEGVADALYTAFRMPLRERRQRMRAMRGVVRRSDIFWWTDTYLKAAISRDLSAFPVVEYYVPQEDELVDTPVSV